MYGMMPVPNSLSPNMLQRRGVLPTCSLGISPPLPVLSRISPHGTDDVSVSAHSEAMPPLLLGKVDEDAASTASATITSQDVSMESTRELCMPGASTSPRGSPGGSPPQEAEPQNETFGHKKFDKFRKAATTAAAGEGGMCSEKGQGEALMAGGDSSQRDEGIEVDVKEEEHGSVYPKSSPVTPPGSSNSSDSSTGAEGTKAKRSAKDAHPNLLAYLNSPAQVSSMTPAQPSTSIAPPPPVSFAGFPWHSAMPHNPYSKESSRSTSAIPASLAAQHSSGAEANLSGSMMEMNSKEQFHAAAVSNLKEKLLRKFDSSENLHKASSGNIAPLAVSSAAASCEFQIRMECVCPVILFNVYVVVIFFFAVVIIPFKKLRRISCLLYTSDAADDC